MKEEPIYQSCTSCKYFKQHYFKNGLNFRPINCGHCQNFKLSNSKRKSFPFTNGCERWEENTETISNADVLQDIKLAVANTEKQLQCIASILNEIKEG